MGYVLQLPDGRFHAKGRLMNDLQDAFVYKKFPTNKVNAYKKRGIDVIIYECEIRIIKCLTTGKNKTIDEIIIAKK